MIPAGGAGRFHRELGVEWGAGGDRIGCREAGAGPSGYLRPSPSFRQAVVEERMLLQNYTRYLSILWRSRLLWGGDKMGRRVGHLRPPESPRPEA